MLLCSLCAVLWPTESQYSIQVLGIHADFCLGEQVFREIEEALQGYEIGILGKAQAASLPCR